MVILIYGIYIIKKYLKLSMLKIVNLAHIIQWNDKYIIVADTNNKSFNIIDIENSKVISNIEG